MVGVHFWYVTAPTAVAEVTPGLPPARKTQGELVVSGGAAGFANDTRFASGAPGMKTFLVAAAYDDYTVLAAE